MELQPTQYSDNFLLKLTRGELQNLLEILEAAILVDRRADMAPYSADRLFTQLTPVNEEIRVDKGAIRQLVGCLGDFEDAASECVDYAEGTVRAGSVVSRLHTRISQSHYFRRGLIDFLTEIDAETATEQEAARLLVASPIPDTLPADFH